MSETLTLVDLIKQHLSWIVGFFSFGMAVSSVLILIGTMREKISRAARAAENLRRELYAQDGKTNYVPRSEYDPERSKIEKTIAATRLEILANCARCRNDCRTDLVSKLEEHRKDIRELTSWVMGAVSASGDRRSGKERRQSIEEEEML